VTAVAEVSTIKPHVGAIKVPESLRSLPGWVVWRYEENPDSEKPRKVPYYVSGERRHGVQGSVNDRARMATFDAARAYASRKGFDGVGLALMPEFNLVALDFDNCVKDGQLHPTVAEIASQTYAEYSPSGQGVRCFFTGNLGNKKDIDHPVFGFEVFSTKGFVTLTGNALDIVELIGNGNTIADLTPGVHALYAERFGKVKERDVAPATHEPLGLKPEQIAECLAVIDPDLPRDKWLQVGMALHHEFLGSDEGFDLWDAWSSKGGNSSKYTNRDDLLATWRSFGRYTDRPVTARSLVRLANENGARIVLNGPASLEDFEALAVEIEDSSDFQDISDGALPEAKAMRFEPIQAGLFATGAHPGWVIKGVLPKAELVVVYGASGSGKSFVVLDMVAAISRGIPWRGHKVKQGKVVYVAAEGSGGFRKRMTAYAARQGISLADIELFVIPDAPNLLMKEDSLDLAKAIRARCGEVSVVVLDTFAQVTPGGNENAGEDIGKALAHCKGLNRALSCVVILVHHSGKDATKGARGWSGLRAAADAEFEVMRLPNGRVLRTSKQKDGDDESMWGFDLDVVDIGVDEDGDPVTSCVIKETEVNLAGATEAPRWKGNDALVVRVIEEMAEFQTAGIEVEEVKKEAIRRLVDAGTAAKSARDMVNRAFKKIIGHENSPYELAEDGTLGVV
jgi:KaiC/GvpD/RAD55 family RecA-like ATPase